MNDQYAIGIDIGGTNIRAGLVKSGEIIGGILQSPIPESLDLFNRIIEDFVGKLSLDKKMPVGVALPGVMDYKKNKLIGCHNISYLTEINFDQIIPQYTPKFGNDVDMALLGELEIDSSLKGEEVLLLSLGTGLGSAFYFAGKGSWENPFSANAGHLKVAINGKECSCGELGCLEAYFSARALTKEAQAKISPKIEEAKELFRLAEDGEETANEIVDEAANYLGVGLANLINTLGSNRVIFTGKLSLGYNLFEEKALASAAKNIYEYKSREILFSCSKLIDKGAIIGAATFAKISKDES